MTVRPRYYLVALLITTLLAGCGGNPTPQVVSFVPSATSGAKVPTRQPTGTAAVTDTPQPTETLEPTLSPTPATPVAEAVREMPVRNGPSSSYPVIATLSANNQLGVIGISEDGNWFQVVLADGTKGWLSAAAASINTFGDVRGVPVALAPTNTPTDTATPLPTETPTTTFTPTFTETATPTETATATPTVTPSETPTLEPSATTAAVINATPQVISSSFNPPQSIGTGDFNDVLRQLGIAPDNGSLGGELAEMKIDLTGKDNWIQWEPIDEGTYGNFVAQTTLHWGPGAEEDYCGFRFRGDDENSLYTIQIDRFGNMWFVGKQNNNWGDTLTGNGNAIRVGTSDTNELVLLALGDVFTLYINGQNSGQFQDSALANGQVSVLAGTYENSDETFCEFTNSKVWRLDRIPGGPQAALPIIPINYGDLVDGTISGTDAGAQYTFSGQAGDVISITMNRASGDLDAELHLMDPNGAELIFSDDLVEQSSRDAAIGNFRLPVSGTYTIVATRFQGQIGISSGGYSLSLDKQ